MKARPIAWHWPKGAARPETWQQTVRVVSGLHVTDGRVIERNERWLLDVIELGARAAYVLAPPVEEAQALYERYGRLRGEGS